MERSWHRSWCVLPVSGGRGETADLGGHLLGGCFGSQRVVSVSLAEDFDLAVEQLTRYLCSWRSAVLASRCVADLHDLRPIATQPWDQIGGASGPAVVRPFVRGGEQLSWATSSATYRDETHIRDGSHVANPPTEYLRDGTIILPDRMAKFQSPGGICIPETTFS